MLPLHNSATFTDDYSTSFAVCQGVFEIFSAVRGREGGHSSAGNGAPREAGDSRAVWARCGSDRVRCGTGCRGKGESPVRCFAVQRFVVRRVQTQGAGGSSSFFCCVEWGVEGDGGFEGGLGEVRGDADNRRWSDVLPFNALPFDVSSFDVFRHGGERKFVPFFAVWGRASVQAPPFCPRRRTTRPCSR